MTRRTVSVVVCTRRRPAQLTRCLEALARLDPPADELIVIDNSPGGEGTDAIAARFGARYVVEPLGGASRARNTGALIARCKLVAFTDDDAIPDPAWLEGHTDAFGDPVVGATTGRVLPLQSTGEPPATCHEGDFGTTPFRVDASTPGWFERTNFGRAGIGPNMVFRRSLIEQGLRFSEALGPGTPIVGAEEHRAFYDVVRKGQAVVYVPTAIVRHLGPLTPEQARRRRRRILEVSVAYGVMLAVEDPAARPVVLRELGRALRGGGMREAPAPGYAVRPAAARIDAARALLVGPLLYVRTLLRPGSRRQA